MHFGGGEAEMEIHNVKILGVRPKFRQDWRSVRNGAGEFESARFKGLIMERSVVG